MKTPCMPIVVAAALLAACGSSPGPIADFDLAGEDGTLTVRASPFGLSWAAAEGAASFSTAAPSGERFPLSFGFFPELKSYHFYDPCKTQEQGWGARWVGAGDVTRKEEIDGGVRLTVAVDRAAGKGLTVDVTREPGVGFKVIASVEEPAGVAFARLAVAAGGEERFFGLGERFDGVDARGGVYEMFTAVSGRLTSGTNEVHVPVPFYVSSAGYGLFVEDLHPGCFEMDAGGSGVVQVTYSTGAPLALHLVTGGSMAETARRYGKLTGPAVLPPPWAFSPMQWRNELPGRDDLIDDAEAIRAHDIPGSLIWIDNPWQTAYNDFTFNTVQFPDPAGMLRQVEDLGFRTMVWSTPYLDLSDDSEVREGMATSTGGLYEQADAAGYFVKNRNGDTLVLPWKSGFSAGRIDFTNPGAVAFWQDLVGRVTSMGITGFKLDYGEEIVPGLLGGASDFHFADGSDGMTMHKRYSVLYQKTYRDRVLADRGESFILGRSSTFGGQREVEAIWPGDLDSNFLEHGEPDPEEGGKGAVGGLPSAISALQNLAVSGFPCFGSDTGGYRGGAPTKEVLVRWAQHTALTPVMQLGGGGKSHNPWDFDLYDQETLDLYRTYARLHQRLFPLWYTLAKRATDEGTPPVLPVAFFEGAGPGLAEAAAAWDEYVVGETLLVAPVHEEGAASRQVLFPPGAWIDWWTGELTEGGTSAQVDAPLAVLPLWARRGSVVPMISDDVDTFVETTSPDLVTLAQRKDLLFLRVYPDGEGGAALFEGTSAQYVEEASGVTLDLAAGEWFSRFVVELDWKNRGHASSSLPASVTKDGAALEKKEGFADVAGGSCAACWALDEARGVVAVSTSGAGRVVVSGG